MSNTYDLGDLVQVVGVFRDSSGAVIDPTTVSLAFKTPADVKTTRVYLTDDELVKDSTGAYHVNLSATENGTWYYRWFSTGTGQAAQETSFKVLASQTV